MPAAAPVATTKRLPSGSIAAPVTEAGRFSCRDAAPAVATSQARALFAPQARSRRPSGVNVACVGAPCWKRRLARRPRLGAPELDLALFRDRDRLPVFREGGAVGGDRRRERARGRARGGVEQPRTRIAGGQDQRSIRAERRTSRLRIAGVEHRQRARREQGTAQRELDERERRVERGCLGGKGETRRRRGGKQRLRLVRVRGGLRLCDLTLAFLAWPGDLGSMPSARSP